MKSTEVARDPANFPDYTERFTLESHDEDQADQLRAAAAPLATVDLPEAMRKADRS